ncbi:MAG: TonB-dependent receptor [Bacteroidales bacterium]|nr:TonB-dependent receptor [Bacteroidales bacterium]
MKHIFLLTLIIFFCQIAQAQKPSIYGVVTDKSTGELLPGATVWVNGSNVGTSTNKYGFYSLRLHQGSHTIQYSFIGFDPQSETLVLKKDTTINIELTKSIIQVGEISVSAKKKDRVNPVEMSTQTLEINTIKSIPAMMGEADVLKSLQFLPGIQTTNEGTTNLSIRGGSFDQNLILLDEAPVYNASHALGFFSTFNPDAIQSVKVYKAAYPLEYGGRISSVIDVRMKEGNNKKLSGSGGVGLISSRLMLEGPIKKDTASFMISGRYSYAGFTANSLGSLGKELNFGTLKNFNNNNEINFFDLNAKFNYKLNDRNHLFFSTYAGHDHFYYYDINNKSELNWGNLTGTLRWNHIFSSKLFSNTTMVFSNYRYAYILLDDAMHFSWSSNLKEADLKVHFDYFLNPDNHFRFGVAFENHFYAPGFIEPRGDYSIITPFSLDDKRALIVAAYFENDQLITDKLRIDYGLRYVTFFQLGAEKVYHYSENFERLDSAFYSHNEIVQFYQGLEPRISLRYLINDNNSIKASFTRSKQYQHLVSNSSVGMPTDVWLPADSYIKPQSSNQYALGYFSNLFENQIEFSAEIYYKDMFNLIDYKDNADLFLNNNIETQVLSGKGKSFGLELFFRKDVGRFTGWVSYTLSKTSRKIEGINNNEWYPARYDHRHNLSLIMKYDFNDYWSFSSVFKYTSGGNITVPEGTFNFQGVAFQYYTARNGYLLPAYHRQDIAFTYKPHRHEHNNWKGEWNFGVYNVYDRKNVFAAFVKQGGNLTQYSAKKMYLYGIIPYVSYNIKF